MKAKKKSSSRVNASNKPAEEKNAAKKKVKKKGALKAAKATDGAVLNKQEEKPEKKKEKKHKINKITGQKVSTPNIGDRSSTSESRLTPDLPSTLSFSGDGANESKIDIGRKEEKKLPPELEGIEIPRILFEGDTPAPVEPHWMDKKYALGHGTVKTHFASDEESFELPESYGTEEMILTARDPYWIYAAWDLSMNQIRRYNRLSATGNMVLRIYVDKAEGMPVKEIQLYPHSRDWFINVDTPGLTYVVVLGYYDKKGSFVNVIVSQPVKTPQPVVLKVFSQRTVPAEHAVSPEIKKEIITTPVPDIFEAVTDAAERKISADEKPSPLIEQKEKMKEPAVLPSPGERALLMSMAMPFVHKGSVEMLQPSEAGVPAEKPISPFQTVVAPSSIESWVSSQAGGGQQERKFWFNIQAEIIIYGATEPDAIVEIAGEKIKLRPDGSFTLRFALPDGFNKLPVSATSADGKDYRRVNLEFSRKTTQVVGETRECPHISPSIPENMRKID